MPALVVNEKCLWRGWSLVNQARPWLTMKNKPQLNNISCSCVIITVVVVGEWVWLLSHVRPTSLDAVVYGHLQPLLKAPLGNSALHTHLKACRNLVAYCQRISNEYFPLSPEGSVCICCCYSYCSVLVYFTTFIVTVLNDWLGRTSPKWPICASSWTWNLKP